MGIRVALNHVTKYTYDRPVSLMPHVCGCAPRAARPDSRSELFALDRADSPLPELAARPVQQLPRPARLPEAGVRVGCHHRSDRGPHAD